MTTRNGPRRRRLAALLALLTPVVVACASTPGSAGGGDDEPVRIGLAVSLSGAVADTGTKLRDGAQLWVDEGHKILGRPVELVVRDDESSPATAARLYERFISVEKVDALVGPYGSGPSAAVAKVTDRHKRFVLMSGAAASTIFTDSDMAVQLMSPEIQLTDIALRLANEKGYKSVALAAIDNPYGHEIIDGVTRNAKKYGMSIVHNEIYDVEPRDLSSMILSMKSKNPDVVYVGAYVPDGILFMRQAKAQGLNAKMFILGATGPVTPEFPDSLGPTADYVMGTAQWVPEAPYPGVQEFLGAWKKAHPDTQVDYVQATGYAAMEVLSKLAKDAGSLDDQKLLEAAQAADYQTMYGGFKLDKDGVQIADRGLLTQIQDGKILPVYPGQTDWKPQLPTPAWRER